MNRAEFWYVFGLAALTLIILRLRATRRADWQDPMAITFTLCLFLPAFGTLSKQPVIANVIDSIFGYNAAWLAADILFISGVCAGIIWIDMLARPELKTQDKSLFRQWRIVTLIIVAIWMVLASRLADSSWVGLERGSIDVDESLVLLTSRLAYFGYSIWGLIYLSISFYHQRQHMRDRKLYIRMTIPWAGITLAIASPVVQAIGTVYGFFQGEALPILWSSLWGIVTITQIGVATSILGTFLPPAYHLVVWVDKQLLIHRLLRVRRLIHQIRPDLVEDVSLLGPGSLIAQDPDLWLATLVNELEMAKQLMGPATYEVVAPAGSVMPEVSKYALKDEQIQFVQGLSSPEPVSGPKVTGDFYTLARWYAALTTAL